MAEFVTTEVRDAVACITLTRPPANAFDLTLSRELGEAVRAAAEDDGVGAIVITGGRRLFAAGADLTGLASATPAEAKPQVDALGGVCDLLEAVPTVSVAAINGYALGGGLEVALACDLRVAAEDAQLGQPEIKLGVIPGAGGTQRLVPLIGLGRAKDLVYTGRPVDAAEALRIGLVDRVVAPDDVLDAALALARTFAAGPRDALAAAKRALRASVEAPGAEGIAEERALFLQLFATADQAEGMAAFLEKRPPVFGADA
ncbi:MAG TPA: enoyl-CoA hydratase-related protein [Actinomycetota bacterium]|nr:enoyl-CoA hydratase-related protein [Actinomycetota bacterium]